MTARQIQRVMIGHRYRRNVCLPNYTPRSWMECDVFELTRAGSFREYEIKVSRADFRQDASKSIMDGRWRFGQPRPSDVTKHQLLEKGDPRGPSQFWFVCPKELLKVEDIPRWAGLIWFDGSWPRQVRPAPRLHREPASKAVRQHAMSICYWRYLSMFVARDSTVVERSGLS